MPVHRLTNGDPYAVEIRPGSSVTAHTEGELILLRVSYGSPTGPTSMMIVVPTDVASRMVLALHRSGALVTQHDDYPHL